MATAAVGMCIKSILKYFENLGSSFKRSGADDGPGLCCRTVIPSLEKLLLIKIGFAVLAGAGADIGTGGGDGGSGGGDNCGGGVGGS
jgi:hypothetical protein